MARRRQPKGKSGKQVTPPLLSETVTLEGSSPTPSQPRANKAVLRVAWLVIGVGVLVAMSAAVTGGMNPNANVLPVRNLAAVIMLMGLVVVLGAYRVAWLQKLWEKSEMAAQATPRRRPNDVTLSFLIVFLILLGGGFFVLAVVSLAGGIVSAYAILLLRSMILAALASLIVYGKGYLRTFCLGAIIPLGLQAASAVGSAMFYLPPSIWQRSGLSNLEGNLTSLIVGGVLALAAGVVSMIVRFLVENLQGSRQRQRFEAPPGSSEVLNATVVSTVLADMADPREERPSSE